MSQYSPSTKISRIPAVAINLTNAVPKRVLQISSVLEKRCRVEQICWDRFSRANVSNGIIIQAKSVSSYMMKLARILIFNHYKIILFDDLRLLPLVVVLGRLTGARLIYNRMEVPTVDAAQRLSCLPGVSSRFAKSIVENIESLFVRGVHEVLTVPLSKDEQARLNYWENKPTEVWNVPEVSSVGAKRYQHGGYDATTTLIYSGAISVENGLKQYLELVCRLGSVGVRVRLILIGRLWSITEEELNAMILDFSCYNLVQYKDWVPYGELMELLATADIGLAFSDPSYEKYTYLSEGASRKIFTYMAAGLPVIAAGAFGRTVEEEGSGYFCEYNNMEAMLKAARHLSSSPEARHSMGEAGRQAILRKYNWESEQTKIEEMLRRIIS